jgi:hypothetical protein
MPNRRHFGHSPTGPDEGEYDVRQGAASYAGIAASVGSLAVTAIVLVFTVAKGVDKESIALATGLLSIAFMGSILGAFAFAAIGAEKDPTANIGKAVIYASLPVTVSLVGTFGAFEVLASTYTAKSAWIFTVMTGVVAAFAVAFNAASIPDSLDLHPTIMPPDEYDQWRERQWLQDRPQARRIQYLVIGLCAGPIIIATALSALGVVGPELTTNVVNGVILLGVVIVLMGALRGFVTHPERGNDQKSLSSNDAWIPNVLLAVFTCILLVILP